MMASSCCLNPMSRSLSASSKTSTSNRLRPMVPMHRFITSSIRPGVPTSTWAPSALNVATSWLGSLRVNYLLLWIVLPTQLDIIDPRQTLVEHTPAPHQQLPLDTRH
jgi:hypothetical protein